MADISFRRPKKRRLESRDSGCDERKIQVARIHEIQQDKVDAFVLKLRSICPKAVLLSSFEPCVRAEKPNTIVVQKLPLLLKRLHNPAYNIMTPYELMNECQSVFDSKIIVTHEEAAYLEQCTRLQSQSLLWHQHRTGRITASRFHAVAHTPISSPSRSLIKEILVSNLQFTSPAIQWGIQNEPNAREQYLKCQEKEHSELWCSASGLCVNPKHPHLGATPDGVVNCKCCGKGILEIKCPFKHKNKHPHDVTDCMYCLQPDKGEMHLKHNHEYYYQVQGQIAVCEANYCDFVCWTPEGIHIERILPDPVLFGEVIKPALDNFFVKILLPLLTHW